MRRFFSFNRQMLLWAMLLMGMSALSAVKLPRLVSNGMVLQRGVKLPIWGWANGGEKITIEFNGKRYQAKADKLGNWQTTLPAMEAGGPYVMKINDVVLQDIMIGEVWLCSGQSNMELPIRRVMDLYEAEVRQIHYPNIRMFRTSNRNDSDTPQNDYKDGNWQCAVAANIMDFPAVPYFYAERLHHQLGVPIGLIQTAIGGSPAESWVSGTLAKPYRDEWEQSQARIDSIRQSRKNEAPFNWFAEVNSNDPGAGRWSKDGVDVTDWSQISLPGYWTDKGVTQKNGSLWFYKEFEVPDSLVHQPGVLRLGRIIDSDSAFVNGTFVGTVSYQYPPRIYSLPDGVLKAGINRLMVRVFCPGGKGGFVEEKPYEVRLGTQVIDLTGDWKYHSGGEVKRSGLPGNLQFKPGGLYNALIHPVIRYGIKGVIWYQGESNTGRALAYESLFQSLITDWRSRFGQPEMPFLYVQLANLGRPNKQITESGWAQLREAQRRTLSLPATGMAVSYDLGEWNDIHPLNKKDVADRLALEAMRVAYGDTSVVSSGPLYESLRVEGNSLVLSFSSVGSGLFANSYLDGFQIAGEDGRFVWAEAVVLSRNTVKVWSPRVSHPVKVRYAWEDNPVGANLMNKEGLPASPFEGR
ncbi:MAG: hypothetical protein JXR39_13145 [Marinilabiliaceae bacterium]|nr:hypothetical protein [Marinilabiliaceae bacterium]